ncbi:uncharacterized protein LOC116251497 isoform X1 [Nymphaea colorata]|nr:uncharacterized protein LOC116251497 isoform X1 [Nymphaea colorata]
MIEQFINFVIRPPRAEYNPDQYLWETEFTLGGRKFKREDIELRNGRGHTLQCSHYVPSPRPENIPLPCVIYCHGNSGCRADANDAAVILLPSNITLFTLDFSGSGLSEGEYVSLGWHEKDDLKVAVSYLRRKEEVSCIGLWGRSMGAVTSLLYGADDPTIAGMVLDSAFSNLFDLMMELVDVYRIRLPKFTVKMAVQYMRHIIQKRARFDIMDLNASQTAPRTFIPALFAHGTGDAFILPHHSDIIFKSYAGDKNIIKFEGDHNSPRPQFFYDSASIFFYNVLHPPQAPSSKSSMLYHNSGEAGAGRKEFGSVNISQNLLPEIPSALPMVESSAGSSSSADVYTKSVGELLSSTGVCPPRTTSRIASSFGKGNMAIETDRNNVNQELQLQDKSRQGEECCSHSSSNYGRWGRCSSLGAVNDESSSADCTRGTCSGHQAVLRAVATPLRKFPGKSDSQTNKPKDSSTSKPKESLSQRLRSCISKHVNPRRHLSS